MRNTVPLCGINNVKKISVILPCSELGIALIDGPQRSPVEKNNVDTATVITKLIRTNESEPYIFFIVYNTVTIKTHTVAIDNCTAETLKVQHVSIP